MLQCQDHRNVLSLPDHKHILFAADLSNPDATYLLAGRDIAGPVGRNTVSGAGSTVRDGFEIRRAAAEKRIPCFTFLDTARVAVENLLSGEIKYNVETMNSYIKSD